MTANGTPTIMLEGPIEQSNERGIRVQGSWANVSRFKEIGIPTVGTPVRLRVDQRGFITHLEILAPASPHAGSTVTRDDRITRLAVLKAAADFMGQLGQAREQIKADHVLAVADKWLAWVEKDS